MGVALVAEAMVVAATEQVALEEEAMGAAESEAPMVEAAAA